MLKLFSCLLFCLFTFSGYSQNSKDLPIELKNCTVHVEANMFTATTSLLMEFYNPNQKVMDGQYDFALQQGQVITGFALDINGKLREGVIVDKKQGRVAYENTIRRRIDPGLLEMTGGNNYRVRIYPMPSMGTRSIKIIISQVLIAKKNALHYYLPFSSTGTVKNFDVNINVAGSQYAPIVDRGVLEGKNFSKTKEKYFVTSEEKNIVLAKPLSFQIPFTTDTMVAYSDSSKFFAVRLKLSQNKQPVREFKSVTVFWDVSSSAKKRDIKKEIAFLEKFITDKKLQSINMVTFSNSIHKTRNFKSNEITAISKFLHEQQIDGGTQLGVLDCTAYNADVFLLFSDGLSNTGKHEIKTADKMIFPVNSSTAANHTLLQQLAQKTGGSYIDLNISNEKEAVESMFKNTMHLLAVSQGGKALQHSLDLPFSTDEYLTISGIADIKNEEIELTFGNAGLGTFKEKISLAAGNEKNISLHKIFLLQKFDALQSGFVSDGLKTAFARKAEFVTATTSFIVLDNLNDYIDHGIVPPAELAEEYLKKKMIVDQKAKELLASKENEEINNLKKAAGLYNDRIRWWSDTESTINLPALTLPKSEMIVNGRAIQKDKTAGDNTGPFANLLKGGNALEEVVVTALGIQRQRKDLGYSTSQVKSEELTQSSPVNLANGLQGKVSGLNVTSVNNGVFEDVKINIRGIRSLTGNNSPMLLLDGVQTELSFLSSINPNDVQDVTVLKGANGAGIYGPDARNGVIVVTTKRRNSAAPQGVPRYKNLEDVEYVTELKQMEDAASIYKHYLEIKHLHENDIGFYTDAAQVLFEAGDKNLALRVLSNLAEIDMENHQAMRAFGYILESWKMYDEAISVYEKILAIKDEEPQSYRDLALAYDQNGQHEQAVEILYKIITKNFYQYEDRYRGIKSLLLNEMNAIINRHPSLQCLENITAAIIKPLPVDIRIVIDWNKDETDIDLHITEPGGEKCFYGYKQTKNNGRLSEDFTQGNGPEEYQIKNAVKGRYSIMVNYYGDRYQKQQVMPLVKLTVYKNFGKPDQTIHVQVFNLLNQSGLIEIENIKF